MSTAVGGSATDIKNSAMATGSFALSGKQSSLVYNEAADQFGMADDAKVVGGDNVELGGQIVKAGADYLGGEAVKIGDNSSFIKNEMDASTKDVLLQALAISARNAENFMALAAGEPAPNPQDTPAPTPTAQATDSKLWKVLGVLFLIGAVIAFFSKGKKK